MLNNWNFLMVLLFAALGTYFGPADCAGIPVHDKDRKSEWYIQYNGSCNEDIEISNLQEIDKLVLTPVEERKEKFFMEFKKFAAFICLAKYYQQDPIVVTGFGCVDDKRCGCENYQILEVVNGLPTCRVKIGRLLEGECFDPLIPCETGAMCDPKRIFPNRRQCRRFTAMTMEDSTTSTTPMKVGDTTPSTSTTGMYDIKRNGGEKTHIVFQKSLPRWTIIFLVFMNVVFNDGSTVILWSE